MRGSYAVPQWVTLVSMMPCTIAALIGLCLIVRKLDAPERTYSQAIQYLLDLFFVSLQLKLELGAAGCCPVQPLWVQRVTQDVTGGIRLPYAVRAMWTSSQWGSGQHKLLTAQRATSKARGWLCTAQGFIFMTSRVCYSWVAYKASTSLLSFVPGCCRISKNRDWIYLLQKI